jgi:hypothetical protein
MAYKSLGDKLRAKCLIPFLFAANLLPGVLVTFLVDKSIPRLIGDHALPSFFPELVVAERGWNQGAFHRLCLVASFAALLINGLSAETQDILWVCDQDEIAPNPKKHNHAGHVIHHHIGTYSPRNRGTLVFVTTEADLKYRRIEDVVAIPDLAAGTLAEVMSSVRRIGKRCGMDLWIQLPADIPDKARLILEWFGTQGYPLRRVAVVLQADNKAGVSAELLSIARGPDFASLRSNSRDTFGAVILS